MKGLNEFLQDELRYAQATQEEFANRTRMPAPAYQVGDMVWLNAKNIRTERPMKKLDWKSIGLCRVTRIINSHAYELELPASMKIHNVFYTSLLRPASTIEPIPGQIQPQPPPVVARGEEYWEVDEIFDSRYNKQRRQFEYKVKWTGFDDPTWEPAITIQEDAPDAVRHYHDTHPRRPQPAFDRA